MNDADTREFDLQVEDAINYITLHKKDIKEMVDFTGIDGVILDFGIQLRDTIIHSDYLPCAFLQIAGEIGIGVVLSQY